MDPPLPPLCACVCVGRIAVDVPVDASQEGKTFGGQLFGRVGEVPPDGDERRELETWIEGFNGDAVLVATVAQCRKGLPPRNQIATRDTPLAAAGVEVAETVAAGADRGAHIFLLDVHVERVRWTFTFGIPTSSTKRSASAARLRKYVSNRLRVSIASRRSERARVYSATSR